MRFRLTLDRIVLFDVAFLEPVEADEAPLSDFPAPTFGFVPETTEYLAE